MRLRGVALCFVLFALLAPRAARAEDAHELHYDLRIDVPVTAIALSAWIVSQLGQHVIIPDKCRLCGTNTLDERTRDALVWQRSEAAHRASNWLAFGVVPVGALVSLGREAVRGGKLDDTLVDGLLVTEAVAIAAVVNQLVKYTVLRQRPFAYAENQSVLDARRRPSDDNVSFYSGHASFTFSVVSAAATVARLRGYDSAPWIWGVGIPLAAATAYFRVAADRHYLTDVLTGAAMGTLIGIGIPRLFHGRRSESMPAVGVNAQPAMITLGFTR